MTGANSSCLFAVVHGIISSTNKNLQMCKNIIRFFYNNKVEQRFPKATIICGKEVRKCLSN